MANAKFFQLLSSSFISALILSGATLPLAHGQSLSAQKKVVGQCESLLRNNLDRYFESGTIGVGKFTELERTFRANHVSLKQTRNIRRFLEQHALLGIELLSDTVETINQPAVRESIYLCIAHGDCTYNDDEDAAAVFLKFPHRGSISFFTFNNLPLQDSPAWVALEQRGFSSRYDKISNGIILKPHRDRDIDNSELLTLEGEFFHELLHLADTELIRAWAEANLRLIKHGKDTDRLFQKFARHSLATDRIFIDNGFYSLFSESRAYYLTFAIRMLLNPKPEDPEGLKVSALVTAWGCTASLFPKKEDSDYNLMKLAGLPEDSEYLPILASRKKAAALARRMEAIAVGPNNWSLQMRKTIQRADQLPKPQARVQRR